MVVSKRGSDPIGLILLGWVETTNYMYILVFENYVFLLGVSGNICESITVLQCQSR